MTTPLEQANEKRTFWKIMSGMATVLVGLVLAVATRGKFKKL